jgi:PadR family transcriptional regulator, regulatory protein PadR
MGPRPALTAQTLAVLAALRQEPLRWQHGYALAKQTGLKSGTLYPILMRLTDRGLMEARWQDQQPPGRPRRHLYRLTPEGLATASVALEAMAAPAGRATVLATVRTRPSPRRQLPAQG